MALPPRKGAAREESFPPKAPRRCLPPLGLSLFSYLLVHGPLGAGALGPYRPRRTPLQPMWPPRGRWTPLVDPRTPFGTPGTIPIKCETFSATKIRLPIYKSLPPDHSGTPRDVRDLIRDSEQPSFSKTNSSYNTYRHQTLSVWTLRVRELCRHDRDTSPVNNQ